MSKKCYSTKMPFDSRIFSVKEEKLIDLGRYQQMPVESGKFYDY